jgi:CBS domain containing-hemolysin-like protein
MTALALVAVVVLVLLNGFFVAAEFALVRVRRSRVEEMASEERRGGRAKLIIVLLDDLSRYLAACQLGITFTSLGIGFLGEPAVGHLIEEAIGEEAPKWVSTGVSFALAYLITTSLHITLGEQIPKIYSIEKAESTALRIARPLYFFAKVFRPMIVVLNGASNWVLRRIGINTGGEFEEGGSPEELKQIIAQSLVGGHIDPGEATMLTGVFHLHEQQARQVMTPAPALVTVDVSEDVETALQRCVQSGHTRLIVTEENNQDRVKGIVHANQLAQLLLAEGTHASIDHLVRDVPIVPETKPLDDLLADLQRERSSLAVVIDEYGRTAGIVTVEDIVEEVVGEIDDETDPQGGEVRRLANGDWFVRGHVALNDLIDYGLELPVDSDAYNSVGGFVFGELGRLPKRGDTVTHNGYSIRVESVRENRIEAVRIRDRHVPRADTNVQS